MISVIMSVYNGEPYLHTAIQSILEQSYQDFEFIIIDDCSSDHSWSILKDYKKKDPRIIILKNKKNLGLASSLNTAIQQARYDLIARMDADDIADKERFKKQYEYIKDNQIDILGSSAINIDTMGQSLGERNVPENNEAILKMMPKLNPLIHPSVMFKKSSFQHFPLYDPKHSHNTPEDYALWFKAAAQKLTFYNLQEPLLQYRVYPHYKSKRRFTFRRNEIKIKYEGYRLLHLPFTYNIYLFIPLILGLIPNFIYRLLKKIDPR